MGFLNGNILIPVTTDPLYPSWKRCNTLLIVVFFERATDIWIDLCERFSKGDLLRVAELQEEIYSLKQDHSQDFIIHFLKGLDDQLTMVHSQILLLNPLPSANRVFSMIIQHERQQHHPSSSMETNPFINVIFGKGRGQPHQGETKPTRKCEFCGCLGHTIDSCFQKNNINPTKCTHCDRVGHSSDVCYRKFGYPLGHPKYPGKPLLSLWQVYQIVSSNKTGKTGYRFPRDSLH
ncbi:hypothetical protein V8G54_023472 [Vigna mungo]|uniref:Retrotransposon gag domain-containing protein n=1 Tax=Vigna mungo TaxID=3915 RepID=A0AAQ3N502_VIGMU